MSSSIYHFDLLEKLGLGLGDKMTEVIDGSMS